MRILHISSARAFGDAERHLVCLCRELARRGHDVSVALRPTSVWRPMLNFLPDENVLHISVRNSFGMFSVRQIARFIDERRVDIVHAHAAKDYIAGSLIRRAAVNVRLVLTRHVERPLKPFHRFALRSVDAAIAVSDPIRERLGATFAPDKIFVVPYGFEFEQVAPAELEKRRFSYRSFHGIPSDVPLVAVIGELKVAGGQRDLVLAASEIVKKVPDCRFVIAGSDRTLDRKFRRELKRLVKVLGLDQNFVWLEQTDDISELIAAADLFVSPSHLRDLTTSAIQAMAAGTAVVTTSVDAIIAPNVRFPAKDPLALAEVIVLFLTNNELRKEASEWARLATRERFGLARMVDETEQLYRRLLNS